MSKDASFRVTVSSVDYNAMEGLSSYELQSRIDTLRDWFPHARFEVEVEDRPEAAS